MKTIALATLCLAAPLQAQAQDEDMGLFNHLGLGLSAGTDGIGIDLATPVTEYAGLRAGISFWPSLKVNKTVSIKDNNPLVTDHVDIQGKLNMFDVKLLADVYPFRTPFHITAGLFYGKDEVIQVTNTSMFIKNPANYGMLGITIGQERIATDREGYIHAHAKVNQLKPYLGIGYGRAVPKNSRVAVAFDLGVKFWGEPGVYAMTINDWGDTSYHKFTYEELDERDDKAVRDAVDIITKLKVFPVLSVRITGRLF